MNRWIRRLLLVAEIGGGFLGLALVLHTLMAKPVNTVTAVVSAIFSGLFLFGIIAGLALVERPALGLRLSAVYQALQVPVFASPLVTYLFMSGLMVGVVVRPQNGFPNLSANLYFGSQFQFFIHQSAPLQVGINLVPVALLIALRSTMRAIARPRRPGTLAKTGTSPAPHAPVAGPPAQSESGPASILPPSEEPEQG